MNGAAVNTEDQKEYNENVVRAGGVTQRVALGTTDWGVHSTVKRATHFCLTLVIEMSS